MGENSIISALNNTSLSANHDAAMSLVAVNILILAANIFIFCYQRYEASKLRRIALKDDFWFRTIVLPTLLEPLQKFSTEQSQKLRELKMADSADGDDYDNYLADFEISISAIIDRCHVVQSHSVSLYNELIEQFEQLEDRVTLYCYKKGTGLPGTPSLFTQTYTETISIIMKFHDENKFVK